MRIELVVALVGVFAVGCSKKASQADIAAAEEAAKKATAALPGEFSGKLEFVVETTERLVFVRPKGWEGGGPLGFHPPGKMTQSYSVASNCDGTCESKDWAEVVDRVHLGYFRDAGLEIEKDEKSEGRRVVVGRNGTDAHLLVALWKDGASRYFRCEAELKDLGPAAKAFETACLSTKILNW